MAGAPNDTAESVADSIESSRRVIPVSTRNAGRVLGMAGVGGRREVNNPGNGTRTFHCCLPSVKTLGYSPSAGPLRSFDL